MEVWQLIVIGAGIHVIVFYSIFDIYFTTPLVNATIRYRPRGPAPAKRLVVFVGDGMRSDFAFGLDAATGKPLAPFLRKVIEDRGAWGISHAQGPTESRPSHVAIFGGFFEDVSAVNIRWTGNPVPYDSVFNQSRHTWIWGSPKVAHLFSEGCHRNSPVTVSHYSASYKDEQYLRIADWEFDEVKRFFTEAEQNKQKRELLEKDQLIFFLHLNSPDSSGHVNLPRYREKYAQTITHLDRGVRTMVELIDKFYNHDNRTAYIVTADHGMADRGNHGQDTPQETENPLVVWGAGVRAPVAVQRCGQFDHDSHCQKSKLQHRLRQDIQQIDLAPLMAYLIGVNYPINSKGELPVSYLGTQDQQKAEGMYANAQQMMVHLLAKRAQVKNRTVAATFWPFRFDGLPKFYQEPTDIPAGGLSRLQLSDSSEPTILLRNIKNLIEGGRFKEAIEESQLVIRAAVQGLHYYHTYFRTVLSLSIALAFLGWMGHVLLSTVRLHVPALSSSLPHPPQDQHHHHHHCPQPPPQQTREIKADSQVQCTLLICSLFAALAVATAALIYMQCLPWTYYLYCLLPEFLWLKLTLRWREAQHLMRKSSELGMLRPAVYHLLFIAGGLLFVVLCLVQRRVTSVGLVLMGAWVVTTPLYATHKRLCQGWMVSCTGMAVFPLLPRVWRTTNFEMVLLSGVLAVFLGFFTTLRISRTNSSASVLSKRVLFFQVLLVALTTVQVALVRYSVGPSNFLTHINQWILGLSLLCPLLTDVTLHVRLFSLCLAFLVPYLFMSILYETLSFLCFMGLLGFWLRIEGLLSKLNPQQTDLQANANDGVLEPAFINRQDVRRRDGRPLQLEDLRLAFFYIFFVWVALFGSKSIFSLTNASPTAFRCFKGVFRSSIMDNLKYIKVAIPLLTLSCVVHRVTGLHGTCFHALSMVLHLMTEFMAMTFFFLVKDFGTWRQVGTSIAHYVISLVLGPALVLTLTLSRGLTSFSLVSLVRGLRTRLLRRK